MPKIDYVETAKQFGFESVREGSNEVPLQHLRSEVFIVDNYNNVMGKGCRVWNVCVIPKHVIDATMDNNKPHDQNCFRIMSPLTPGKKEVDFARLIFPSQDRIYDLYNDVVGVLLHPDDWSRLRTAEVNITALDVPQMVSIVGSKGFGTTGLLSDASKIGFAYVSYGGTTNRGYSGAVYASGASAFGIHQMGGNQNLGVALDFLRMKIKRMIPDYTHKEAADNDSSLDWANKEWFDGDKLHAGIKIDRTNFDEIYVKAKGRYHVFDTQALKDKLGEKKWRSLNYTDAENDFPVFHQSPSCGASSLPQGVTNHVPVPVSAGTSSLLRLCQNSPDAVIKSQSQLRKERTILNALKGVSKEEILSIHSLAQRQAGIAAQSKSQPQNTTTNTPE
jgi:hypothetical protein